MYGELHFNMCKKMGVLVKLENKNWYKRVPKLVETSHETTVTTIWNKQVKVHRTVRNSKRDITIGVMRK